MIAELIKSAVSLLGSQAKLAAACGVSQASIWQAIDSQRCSAELAMAIEKATESRVTARALRPDLPWPGGSSPAFTSPSEQVNS